MLVMLLWSIQISLGVLQGFCESSLENVPSKKCQQFLIIERRYFKFSKMHVDLRSFCSPKTLYTTTTNPSLLIHKRQLSLEWHNFCVVWIRTYRVLLCCWKPPSILWWFSAIHWPLFVSLKHPNTKVEYALSVRAPFMEPFIKSNLKAVNKQIFTPFQKIKQTKKVNGVQNRILFVLFYYL